jgi:hypothetical protein
VPPGRRDGVREGRRDRREPALSEWFVPEVVPSLTDEQGSLVTFDEVWHLD